MPKRDAEPVAPEPPKTELEEIQIQTNNVQNQVRCERFFLILITQCLFDSSLYIYYGIFF